MLPEILCNDIDGTTDGGDNIGMPLRATNEDTMLCIEDAIDLYESRCYYYQLIESMPGEERGGIPTQSLYPSTS
jgi:hypothetical protein